MSRFRNEDDSFKEIPELPMKDNLGLIAIVNELVKRENHRLRCARARFNAVSLDSDFKNTTAEVMKP